MRRIAVLATLATAFLGLGLPARADTAAFTGAIVASGPGWAFHAAGSGSIGGYEGPLVMTVSARGSATIGGAGVIEDVTISGDTGTQRIDVRKLAGALVGYVWNAAQGGSVTVPVPVRRTVCTQFGCNTIDQCVTVTITYTAYPFPAAGGATGTC